MAGITESRQSQHGSARPSEYFCLLISPKTSRRRATVFAAIYRAISAVEETPCALLRVDGVVRKEDRGAF